MSILRFVTSFAAGFAFFLLPIPVGGRFTVPFDLVVQWILETAPGTVAFYCLGLIVLGAFASLLARRRQGFWTAYRSSGWIVVARVLAVPLAGIYFFRFGPDLLL